MNIKEKENKRYQTKETIDDGYTKQYLKGG
jgi:hypothetical protein